MYSFKILNKYKHNNGCFYDVYGLYFNGAISTEIKEMPCHGNDSYINYYGVTYHSIGHLISVLNKDK